MLLGLALAGCGGSDSGGSASASGQDQPQQQVSQGHQPTTGQQQPAAADKSYQEPNAPASQGPHSEVEVENPILADPLPVPVPDDAEPEPEVVEEDPVPDKGGTSGDDTSLRDDPDVAGPEPEQPDPLADRPTLRWDGPLTREDGSKLYTGEISGYRVYFRLRHQDNFQSMLIPGADSDRLTLDAFDPGAYEFAISTLDTEGLESRRADPVPVDLI